MQNESGARVNHGQTWPLVLSSLVAATTCAAVLAGTEHEVLVQSPYAAKGECFGTTVAISRRLHRLFSGVPYSKIPMLHSGRVDVFGAEGWGPQVTFIGSVFPEVMQRGAQFGASMSIDPGTSGSGALVIGAPGEDSGTVKDSGSVEVYSLSLASLMPARVTRILPPVASSFGRFGASVSVDLGDTQSYMVIGEPGGGDTSRPGIAHVYRSTGGAAGPWEPLAQLQSIYSGPRRFGSEVLVSGSHIIISAEIAGGSVECFEIGETGATPTAFLWNEQAESAGDTLFGAAMAMHGDLMTLGCPGRDGFPGKVLVYQVGGSGIETTWSLVQTLPAPEGADCSGFGSSLAMQGIGPELRVGIVSTDSSEPWGGGFADYRLVGGAFQFDALSVGGGDDALGASVAFALDGSESAGGFNAAVAAPGLPSAAGSELAGGVVAFVHDPGSNGDLNHDGSVDGADLARLLGSILNGDCPLCAEDLNHDGVVNGNDIAILLSNWGVVP